MAALKSSKTTLKTVAVVAALSFFASLQLSLADRALAWGAGGGGGGGSSDPDKKWKAEHKKMFDDLKKIVKKKNQELKQQDEQYKPPTGFTIGNPGNMFDGK